ncbi:hypothetical protein Dimus_021971 [Dionaea muscipula]
MGYLSNRIFVDENRICEKVFEIKCFFFFEFNSSPVTLQQTPSQPDRRHPVYSTSTTKSHPLPPSPPSSLKGQIAVAGGSGVTMVISTQNLVVYATQLKLADAVDFSSRAGVCSWSNSLYRRKACGFPASAANRVNVHSMDFCRVRYCCKLHQEKSLVPSTVENKVAKKSGKREHHLWTRRDSARSGQKALILVRIVSELPNEKEAVCVALDKWTAWELEFPLIAAAKALRILKKRNQWMRVIQVAKWMLSRGQGATMTTYDTLLLAFDKERRTDEAGSLWNMILHTHTRSIPKRLFSRMISLYDHHNMLEKIIEVFADMEEVGVNPDEDTVRRVAHAFQELGLADKKELVLRRYGCKWKYIHFKGERVRVRTYPWNNE